LHGTHYNSLYGKKAKPIRRACHFGNSNPGNRNKPNLTAETQRNYFTFNRLLKNAHFTLRQAQGEWTGINIIHNYPFVVSLSNHKKTFSTDC
jgi:hypothetical protein